MLLASTALVLGYHALQFPAIGFGWAVALYTCAAAGRLWPAIFVSVALAASATWVRLFLEPEPVLRVASSGLQELAAVGLVIAFGDAVRSRRGWAAEARERVRRLERDRERETRRRIAEERLRIARDLHDITAHTLAVGGIQLNVAADALDASPGCPGEARSALRVAQQVNREATAELKAAVRVLRRDADDGPPRSPTPGMDEVGRLLDGAREAGLDVRYAESGAARPLPAPVGLAVYRVVQESLTNVLRHARAATAWVRVDYQPAGVSVRVADDGAGPAPGSGPADVGHGLIGLRERTLGLGGTFAAGPGESGGFVVSASIPLEPDP